MKLSIENFKSIEKVHNFEIKPFTILSGINSAGKSSFVQLLLLLKQTLKSKSEDNPLKLDGDLYKANGFSDLISNHDDDKNIKVSFVIPKSEFTELEEQKTTKLFNSIGNYNCHLDLEFSFNKSFIYISLFDLNFKFEEEEKRITFKTFRNQESEIKTNTPTFIDGNFNDNDISNIKINYSAIFPTQISYNKTFGSDELEELYKVVPLTDLKNILNNFFEQIYYIGPSREEPKETYTISKEYLTVGKSGKYVSQILKALEHEPINYHRLKNSPDGGIEYSLTRGTLLEAVNYWVCEEFEMAKHIEARKDENTYQIILKYISGLEVSIKHVGFGISQVLPIIVQGLLLPINGILIVEQPEIHLHPKIQSKMCDFLYSLTLQNRKVVVETHSSHFILRMRRRIAEDLTNEMDDNINLTFIENSLFRTLRLDDYGTILDYYPKDFIELPSGEMRAIIQAQVKKRKANE